MEILINEMSLKGQFGSVDEFISDGLKPLIISINVDNLYDQGTMFRLVRERGLIVDFSITDL